MSGLPFPSPGHLPDWGIKPRFPALAGGFFYHLSHQGSSCVFILLDKMRHTNIFFKVYLSKTQFKLGRVKPEVVGRAPLIEAGGKTFLGKRQKQSKEIIWLAAASVGVFFEKVKLAVCDWLSLGFSFLTFRHFRHRLWFAKVGFL